MENKIPILCLMALYIVVDMIIKLKLFRDRRKKNEQIGILNRRTKLKQQTIDNLKQLIDNLEQQNNNQTIDNKKLKNNNILEKQQLIDKYEQLKKQQTIDKQAPVKKTMVKKQSLQRKTNAKTNVYVMIDKNTGYFKIGRSINPSTRERTLQSEKPTIDMLFNYPATNDCETELHDIYSKKRIRGEWFDLSGSDLKDIKAYFN